MRRVFLVLCCAVLLTGTARALETTLPEDLRALDPRCAAMVEPQGEDLGLFSGLAAIWEQAVAQAKESLTAAAKSGVVLLFGVLLLSTVCHFAGDSRGRVERCAHLVGTLWIVGVTAGDLDTFLGLGRSTMGEVALLSKTLLPAMCSALAAGGGVVSASVRQVLSVFFSDVLVSLIENLLLPLLQVYLASAAAAAVLEGDLMGRAAVLVKKVIVWSLSGILMVYTALLTVCGAVAGSIDQRTLRVAKSALGTVVPVVGKILSGAAETLLASAGVLRSTVGAFGALALFSAVLLPLLRLGGQFLLYRLIALCAGAAGSTKLVRLLDMLGEGYALILAMTASAAVMVLIALVTMMTVVT